MAAHRGEGCVIAGDGHPALARQVAEALGWQGVEAEMDRFADGEWRIKIPCGVEGMQVIIVQPVGPPVNDRVLGLALLIDAARAAGAVRITAVAPYFGYARQEQRGASGEPRSAQVVARLLGAVGLDHLMTLDLHTPALESAFPMPVTLLYADEVFLPLIDEEGWTDRVVVSPDAGGMKRAQRYAQRLDAELAVIAKGRPAPDVAQPLQVLGDVAGRACLVVDDMAATGRTLAGAAKALRAAGARQVHGFFTHAVMTPGAAERLFDAPFDSLVTTDSIPVPQDDRLKVLSVAPLLAKVLAGAH